MEDPRGEIREQQTSGLQSGVVRAADSAAASPEHVQNVRDRLVLANSFTAGFVPGSMANETMPLRQRGQAIEPGGPWATVHVQFVEQRYRAQRVQNS